MSQVNDSARDNRGKERDQWTIVLDFPSALGSEATIDKLNKLVDMDEATKGKPVAIVGQTLSLNDLGEFILKRWEFSNGKLTSLSQTKPIDMGNDLEGLLKLARQRHPSDKTALLIDSHGTGMAGVVGNQGRMSLPRLELAISHGLGKKVDLLDLDSCEMAQAGAIRSLSKSAKHVIASAEFENSGGQNLSETLEIVLEKPTISPDELANEIVARSKNWDVGGDGTGIHTLAHFESQHVSEFDKAMNHLGSLLSMSMKNPSNAAAIRNIIEQIPEFDADKNFQKRDLRLFLTTMDNAIQQKVIPDDSGEMRKAIKQVLAAQDGLVRSYYGEAGGDLPYDKMGGLSVLLPGSSLSDKSQLAESTTKSGACQEVYALADQYPVLFAPFKNEPDVAICTAAAELDLSQSNPSQPAESEKPFNQALGSFIQQQSDYRSGGWANFINSLVQ
jgi:Clostripain family